MEPEPAHTGWLDRSLADILPAFTVEKLLITIILILAIFSRFYILGARVMSHDEVNHVVPSFDFSQGRQYLHDPITHGPFQFHIVALSYILFGDSDFTSRLPAALFSIATVFFGWWGYRRYFGKAGALIASFLLLISPFALFYGRYTRNEAFVGLYALVMLWAILRYLETRHRRYLFLFTLSIVMHFITKETSFIYSAQALIFLTGLLLYRVLTHPWQHPGYLRPFLVVILVMGILGIAAVGTQVLYREELQASGALTVTQETVTPAEGTPPPATVSTPALALFALTFLAMGVAGYLLLKGFNLERLRQEPSFDLLILLSTFVIPQLAPFPLSALNWNIPTNYTSVQAMTITSMIQIGGVVVILAILSAAVGLLWNRRLWLENIALFLAIFTVFYTSLFTNGSGFLTGLLGSLGYWVSQQEVNRGTQPWYYFALVQIPMYEFLPLVGTLVALVVGFRRRLFSQIFPPAQEQPQRNVIEVGNPESPTTSEQAFPDRLPVLALLLFWSFTSLVAYSVAGEKMPWLTYHIAVPMILSAAWAFGYLIDSTAWQTLWRRRGWLVVLLLPVFLLSLFAALGSLLGSQPPFAGKTLVELQATATFLFSALATSVSAWALLVLLKDWHVNQIWRLVGMTFLALLAFQTVRVTIRANYHNYDLATEFLVYAHAARGPKDVLAQVEEISQRTTGGLDIAVAYDNDSLYPYWWYFRHYPNKRYFGESPTRDLQDNPIVLANEAKAAKLESILGMGYTSYSYVRLWWPNQDYWNLTWERIWNAITDPNIRAGLMQIWLNDDFTRYAQATGNQNLTLTNWYPQEKMRMYIRKDIVSQIWNYGALPAEEIIIDPYEQGMLQLEADQMVGIPGGEPGQFQSPRAVSLAQDGTLYVADSRNHRIQHLAPDGSVLHVWGTFADVALGEAPGGTFNEPWGVAVAPDGSVFVTDTWNNRIQKFTGDGQFLEMWGFFGQAESPDAFWGPRGIAVDGQGRVFITDTGNKRVVVFDLEGQYVTEFGSQGFDLGQFSEPVGIALDADGNVYVADTWNQRIQVLAPSSDGLSYTPLTSWDVSAWYGESLDNKPFLAVTADQHVFASDPEGFRVLEFTSDGEFVRAWGDYSTGPDGFGLVSGLAVDNQGGVWVSDAGNHRLMHFTLP